MKKVLSVVLSLCLCIGMLASIPGTEASAANKVKGLVAQWTFDGNVDESVAGLITTEGEKPLKYVDGVFGKAASFNGKDQYLRVDADKLLDLGAKHADFGKAMSISFWIYCDDIESKDMCILRKGEAVGWSLEDGHCWGDNYAVGIFGNMIRGNLNTEHDCDGFDNPGGDCAVEAGLRGSKWQLITYTYDGKQLKLYNNNELFKQSNYTEGYAANIQDLFIGARSIYGSDICEYFKGCLDNLSIYDRALTYNDVDALYQEGVKANREAVAPKEKMVAYYSFDGNLKDSSEYKNNAEKVEIGGTTKYIVGVNGKAITMSKGNYIRIPAADQLNFDKDFTVSFWVKSGLKDQNAPLLYRLNPARGDNGNKDDSTYRIYESNWGGYDFASFNMSFDGFDKDGWCDSGNSDLEIEDEATKKADTWNHITFTYSYNKDDEEVMFKAYCNGKLVNKTDAADYPEISKADGDLYIGYDNDKFFTGAIDELKIYNKCLSATEVSKEYKRVDSISIKSAGKTISVAKGKTATLGSIQLYDVDAKKTSTIKLSSKDLTMTSSNKKIFTVSKGKIKGVKAGTAKLTVTYGGVSKTYTVKVTKK